MPGKIVETKTGKQGQTKNTDQPVNGKIPVYFSDGTKMLCSPDKLKILGFWD
jgi:hypothetical protein